MLDEIKQKLKNDQLRKNNFKSNEAYKMIEGFKYRTFYNKNDNLT